MLVLHASSIFFAQHQVVCQQQHEGGGSHEARAVLEQGIKQHPSSSHLKLELARCIVRQADTDAQIMKGEGVEKCFHFNY